MRTLSIAILGLALCGMGCSTGRSNPAQKAALEARHVDAGFSETYDAASEALFDAGYAITMSDRQGGLLTGTKSDSVRKFSGSNGQGLCAISVQVREIAPRRCAVRVKTSRNGAPEFNRSMLDELWTLMQRQVTLNEPATIAGVSVP